MSKLTFTDDDGCLTEESTQKTLKHTEILECACPQHLLNAKSAHANQCSNPQFSFLGTKISKYRSIQTDI